MLYILVHYGEIVKVRLISYEHFGNHESVLLAMKGTADSLLNSISKYSKYNMNIINPSKHEQKQALMSNQPLYCCWKFPPLSSGTPER